MNPGSGRVKIQSAAQLQPDEVREVIELVCRVADADGVHPLSEHVWLHLRHGGDDRGRHLIARDAAGSLIGYGHLDLTDEVAGPSSEIVVDPGRRRQGVGTSMIEVMAAATDGRPLRVWAHGEQAAAGEWARALGFRRARALWQMRRTLHGPLPPVALPDGVRLRAFRPGVDDQTWLDLNQRAFAGHPEQGTWTLADLHRRMAEPWFSAAGFLVAIADDPAHPGTGAAEGTIDGRMVGFHWTKVHGLLGPAHGTGESHGAVHAHEAIGEVYVVGVDPAWQGRGLGRALTIAGLHHLRALGLAGAMLYVEASNQAAIDLYASLGFTRWDVDVLYTSSPG